MTCPRLVQCRVQVEAAFVLTRTDLRRNPAEDVIEFSDRPFEVLIAGKHECVRRQRRLESFANRSRWSTSVFWMRQCLYLTQASPLAPFGIPHHPP